MMQNNLENLKKAGNQYRLKEETQLTEKLLEYIQRRVEANQKQMEELIQIRKEKVSYWEIQNAIEEEIAREIQYKNYKDMMINEQNYMAVSLLMPMGVVAVEVYDPLEVIKYMIKAIQTRNAIAISDAEYDEQSVKFLILVIIQEALKKFGIDENLIMILPYEECFYEKFDQVIYTYNEQGKKLRQNQYEKKKRTEKKYVYIEDEALEEQAMKDNPGEKEILKGEMEEAIAQINQTNSMAAVIYTKDAKKAYQFLNLVGSRNVLVNASLENSKQTEASPYELYVYRNLILPIPQEAKEEKIETMREEKSLTVVNQTILGKIKKFLKKLFQK